MILLLALLLGFVAGLRTMIAPAAAAWAAQLGWLGVAGTPLAFMASWWAPWLFTLLALGELVVDQLPSTPSRKEPVQFGGRIVSGALCGATLGAGSDALVVGAIAGIAGAIGGTLGGAAARANLASWLGHDPPAALIEDAFALLAAAAAVSLA